MEWDRQIPTKQPTNGDEPPYTVGGFFHSQIRRT